MARTLITGATGFLGSHLLELLKGEDLRLLVSSASHRIPAGVEVVEGSITNEATVKMAVDGVERIYHLAGRVSRDPEQKRLCYEVHVEGTRLLCRAAREAGVKRIVMASTSGTIAVTEKGTTIPNETYPAPLEIISRWPYYASKYYQEETARHICKGSIELVMVNPSLLLGPGDSRLSSTQDILKFLGRDIPAIPSGGLNFVDVRDVAAACVAAMERGKAGERYLLGGPNWTFQKFFERLERLTGIAAPRIKSPGKLGLWGARWIDSFYRHWDRVPPVELTSIEMAEYYWYLDCSKAERELGFLSRDPGETLLDTVKYLRKHFMAEDFFAAPKR